MNTHHIKLSSLIIAIESKNIDSIVEQSNKIKLWAGQFGQIVVLDALHEMYMKPLDHGFHTISYDDYSQAIDILWENHPYQQEQYCGIRPAHYLP